MALFGNLSSFLGGTRDFLGQLAGTVAGIGNVGAAFGLGGLPAVGPTTLVALPQNIPSQPQVMAARMPSAVNPAIQGAAQVVRGIGSSINRMIAPVLIKVAQATGSTTMTLRRAVRIVRRMGRVLGPVAVAGALGLTIEELGSLILADSQRVRRRMNPANISALRRSMRRIQSFHRLCQKADALRAPRSRRKAPARAGAPGTTIVQAR